MSDWHVRTYGMCKVVCEVCGAEFEVHPLSNAAHPDARLCHSCRSGRDEILQSVTHLSQSHTVTNQPEKKPSIIKRLWSRRSDLNR